MAITSEPNDRPSTDPTRSVSGRLVGLTAGQQIVYAGDRVAEVSQQLAQAFEAGDRLVVDPQTGALLHVTAAAHTGAVAAVDAAIAAFAQLNHCSDDQITAFLAGFAERLDDDRAFAPIAAANRADIERARSRDRSTTRLELSQSMRSDMVAGLRGWAAMPASRDMLERRIDHDGWSVEARRSPLGVIGFVFEGRPNVFADAAGVVRTGNTVVFRIGSDALGTAEAIVEHALQPALQAAGLPLGTVVLVPSAAHAAGWALFSDPRLSLAVARGSGAAVAQLGAVARQAGIPVSLHGTGGAWLVAAADADAERFALAVRHSLDRKVCNTLNVCCVVRERAAELVPRFLEAMVAAATDRGAEARVHATEAVEAFLPIEATHRRVRVERAHGSGEEPFVSPIELDDLAREWEWESSPEAAIHVVDTVSEAVALGNRYSPRFVASLISESPVAHDEFYATIDTPFVGDGFTRWVDGQYALNAPELGLSNWESGRTFGRGAILSGDSVYTVRYRARVSDTDLHR